MAIKIARSTRLGIAISISFSFFIAEIAIGFKTKSIALIADAFHYLNDLIGFIVALVAIQISETGRTNKDLTFGWQRAQLLGAFFNGVFLLALGVSIFLQSLERFIALQRINNPMLVVIIGAIGLGLNIISIIFLHEHDHGHDHHHHPKPGGIPLQVPSPNDDIALGAMDVNSDTHSTDQQIGSSDHHHEHRHTHKIYNAKGGHQQHHHDFGMMGVLLHVAGDAVNNIGVIISGLIIWKAHSPNRYYADPAVGMGIALMILLTSLPLVKKTGHILLQSPPLGIDVNDIKHDLEKIPTVQSVHELHVWRLNQTKSLASAHVVVPGNTSVEQFQGVARTINECLHAYGVHSVTLQPEAELRRRPIASRSGSEEGGRSFFTNPDGITTAASTPAATIAPMERNVTHQDDVIRTGDSPAVEEEEEEEEGEESLEDRRCFMNCGTGCEKMTCCG